MRQKTFVIFLIIQLRYLRLEVTLVTPQRSTLIRSAQNVTETVLFSADFQDYTRYSLVLWQNSFIIKPIAFHIKIQNPQSCFLNKHGQRQLVFIWLKNTARVRLCEPLIFIGSSSSTKLAKSHYLRFSNKAAMTLISIEKWQYDCS